MDSHKLIYALAESPYLNLRLTHTEMAADITAEAHERGYELT